MTTKPEDEKTGSDEKTITRRRTMLIDEDIWRMAGDIGGSNHTEGFRISVKLLHEALSRKKIIDNPATSHADPDPIK